MPGTESLPGAHRRPRGRNVTRSAIASRLTADGLQHPHAPLPRFPPAPARPRRRRPAKPNVVVLLADDLGYGDLGCFGHPTIKTPNLDRLAAEGIKLTSCYAGQSVCSPSRAALLTGRNPNRYGVKDWIPQGSGIVLPRTETTVAARLKAAGYTTCLCGQVAPQQQVQRPGADARRPRVRPLVRHPEQRRPEPPGPDELRPQRQAGRPAQGQLVHADRGRGARVHQGEQGQAVLRVRDVPRPARAGGGRRPSVATLYKDEPDPTTRDLLRQRVADRPRGRPAGEVPGRRASVGEHAGGVHERQRAGDAPAVPEGGAVARVGRARCGG